VRLLVIALGVLAAIDAEAQTPITGLLTVHLGLASGGDTEAGVSPGISMSIIESNGWGTELDLAHTVSFVDEAYDESGITSLMLNVVGFWPEMRVRPFALVGAGLLRVRATPQFDAPDVSRTDWAINAGAGALVMLDEAVGIRGDLRYVRYVGREDALPFVEEGFFDYWRVSIGATWSWPVK
jgi:hypothetical protein